jgi:hypothetical protein
MMSGKGTVSRAVVRLTCYMLPVAWLAVLGLIALVAVTAYGGHSATL